MMQGDSYNLTIEILNAEGNAVTPNDVIDVEIAIGFLRKTYANNEILYADGLWVFPITQEESFKLPPARIKAQVRVVWTSRLVEGTALDEFLVQESISKVVL